MMFSFRMSWVFDLLRVIKNREELKNVPIIMITGTHHQTDHKVKAFQAGADDYVLKPFEMPNFWNGSKLFYAAANRHPCLRHPFP